MDDSYQDISKKLDELLNRNADLVQDIQNLQQQLDRIRAKRKSKPPVEEESLENTHDKNRVHDTVSHEQPDQNKPVNTDPGAGTEAIPGPAGKSWIPDSFRQNLEHFIGANLINKVGILIFITGVAIGTKFAIDKDLITPLMRLILGYLAGLILLFFSFRLRKQYLNFSAVLLAGSMAVLYFMTYAGFVYFGFFSFNVSFALMVMVTLFTVYQSLQYQNQIISIIGLIGAYAIPFVIGGETDEFGFLLSYIALINFGILIISLSRYWRLQYYLAFAFTWLIFINWWQNIDVLAKNYLELSMIFSAIYFLLFHSAFLYYKISYKKPFSFEDVILLLTNSFIFYAIGYANLDSSESLSEYLGLFTILNAVVHAVSFFLIRHYHDKDKILLLFLSGLAVVFVTIAVPVQFEHQWITRMWFVEGLVLFMYGRIRSKHFFEYLAYPVLVLGFFGIVTLWFTEIEAFKQVTYEGTDVFMTVLGTSSLSPFLNEFFLTGMMSIILLGVINWIHFRSRFTDTGTSDHTINTLIDFFIPGLLIFIVFFAFQNELSGYWQQHIAQTNQMFSGQGILDERSWFIDDMRHFRVSWNLIYMTLFFSVMSYMVLKKVSGDQARTILFYINIIIILIFCASALYEFSELRLSYIKNAIFDDLQPGLMNLGIRYIGIVAIAVLLYMNYLLGRVPGVLGNLMFLNVIYIHMVILWILSSEMLHWLDLIHVESTYKLGLSILWGSYAVFIVVLGLWEKAKFLRISGIGLFGLTLVKLFFYDLTELDTLSKTIIFIVLGVLLLIVSYLYNRYQRIILE